MYFLLEMGGGGGGGAKAFRSVWENDLSKVLNDK